MSRSWIITLANGTHLHSSAQQQLARMQRLGIVISGDNLTITAVNSLNGTKIRRHVETVTGREHIQLFSYDGSLKVQGGYKFSYN